MVVEESSLAGVDPCNERKLRLNLVDVDEHADNNELHGLLHITDDPNLDIGVDLDDDESKSRGRFFALGAKIRLAFLAVKAISFSQLELELVLVLVVVVNRKVSLSSLALRPASDYLEYVRCCSLAII